MTPLEVARGFVLDDHPPQRAPRPEPGPVPHPRAVLETLLLEAVQARPCVVAFSGGRDSSALLAVATHVARREGLPDPVPVTRRFPGLPETDESAWQDLVVRHLGLREWVRVELDEELDVLGELGTAELRVHGVQWPPLIHIDHHVLEAAAGGVVIDGEGGDQVFSLDLHRIAPLTRLRAGHAGRTWRALAKGLLTGAPGPVQRRLARRELADVSQPWLRRDAEDDLLRDLSRELAARPVRWDTSIRALPYHRARRLALRNRALRARGRGVAYAHPFLDPRFLEALARRGGALGLPTRTEWMQRLFADVLPEPLLRRRTKVAFNRMLVGTASRRFAEAWDGSGVDDALVDTEALRREWLAEHPSARALPLLQQAWLAARRPTRSRSSL